MRPVIIVSRDDSNPPRALVIYVPVTTQNRGSLYEVALAKLPFLQCDSTANIQGLGSVASMRLERKLGEPDNISVSWGLNPHIINLLIPSSFFNV